MAIFQHNHSLQKTMVKIPLIFSSIREPSAHAFVFSAVVQRWYTRAVVERMKHSKSAAAVVIIHLNKSKSSDHENYNNQ